MVLNYHPTNYTGWPVPAFYHGTSEVQGERKSKFYLSFSEPQPSLTLYLTIQCKVTKNI